MSIDMENPQEVREVVQKACNLIELLGCTVAAQQERIAALEALMIPFPIPMTAPVPVRDISIGKPVDNPDAQPL